MDAGVLRNLPAHLHQGVQGSHGLLEDHGDVPAPVLVPLVLCKAPQLRAVEQDLALGDLGVPGLQANGRQGGHGLAAAGFPHQGHHFAGLDAHAGVPHRMAGFPQFKVHGQVFNGEHRLLFICHAESPPAERRR